MSKLKLRPQSFRKPKAADLFLRADQQWDRGELRSAFRLFLAAARAGDKGAQLNVGYFYDQGIGLRANQSAALRWYIRAYRRGDASAANNIGTIWRDKHKEQRALWWFQRAVCLGNDGSNLEIAKHYLRSQRGQNKALRYLKKILESDRVSAADMEEAQRLLKQVRKRLKRN